MKRILTLMVMTLLIAAVPQTTFSKVKKTTKTTRTTKTTNSTSKKSSTSATSTTSTYNSTSSSSSSSNDQTYPVPKSYVSYANVAPKIKKRLYDEKHNSYSVFTANGDFSDVIYSGRDCFELEVYQYKSDEETIGTYYMLLHIYSHNKDILSLAENIENMPVDEDKKCMLTIAFSNGVELSGQVSLFQEAVYNRSFNFCVDKVFYGLDVHFDHLHSGLLLGIYPNLIGNSNSSATGYSSTISHFQYVSNLFMNYNVTKIVVDNRITIPIDQNKWGTKYTFTKLFKTLAEDSKGYGAFGLTAPASSGSSYSSSSTSSSTTSTTPSYNSSSSSSSSTYTTPSTRTYSTPSYNYSYKPEPKKRFWGFSAGYVQKQWQSKEGGSKEKMGFWEDSKVVHGVQAGFRATPYFKFGLGLNTGLLYEYYYTKSQPMVVDGYDVYGEMQEHALYMPVHLTYRLKFNDFHIYAFGGVGLDYGIMSKVQLKENGSDYVGYDNSPLYETEDAPDWKRFNASYEFGGGLRYKMVELQFTMSRGFLNMSHDSSYKLYQNKPMMFSLGFMF